MKTCFAVCLLLILSLSPACKSGKNSTSLGVESFPLTGTTWRLIELNGELLPENLSPEKRPYIEISDDGSLVAEDGCSRLTGRVILSEGNRIRIEGLISSMNACPGQTFEAAFRKALENCDNYSIQGSFLGLQKGRMEPMARFEASVEGEKGL